MQGATEYGKEMNKELFTPAVVTVADGKVEIEREIMIDAGLRRGCFLENFAVELRASGKWGSRGGFEYQGIHGSHRRGIEACGFLGWRCGKRGFELNRRGSQMGEFCAAI